MSTEPSAPATSGGNAAEVAPTGDNAPAPAPAAATATAAAASTAEACRTSEAPLASGGPETRHTRARDRRKSRKPRSAGPRHHPHHHLRRHRDRIAVLVLLALPLGIALAGPFIPLPDRDRTQPFDPAAPWPGTDYLGSSVLDGVLDGGWGIVATAAAATGLAFLVGLPIGLIAAATRHRWLDEILMRPFDLLLALPSLLLMLLLAAIAPPTAWMLVLIVALVNLPDIARIVRAAALETAHRPAVEAMWLQGESWWRTAIGHIARSILPTVAADAGVRLVGAFYLVAAASFLGVGAGPEASDWAVMVDVNRGGIFLSPWGVVLPAALLVALSVGLNLLFDRLLTRRDPA